MPLETSDEITPPPSSPGVLEQVLLTRDSPEDLNSQLSLCNDQSVPDYLVSAFAYLPYYRTSYIFISPSSLAASHISTEIEESVNEGKVNTKQDETVSYSATSTGYFPYFRTYGELLCEPLTFGLNAEGKKPDNDGKVECEGDDSETTIPPSLDLEKREFSSMTDEEPRVHHLLRDRTSGHCSSTISFFSGLPGLNQPFPSTGYFPYYRTEEELCPDPVLGDRFFPGIEGLVIKEGEGRGETDIWSLSSNCLLC